MPTPRAPPRTHAAAEPATNRIRERAEADAARMRRDAEESARVKSEPGPATVAKADTESARLAKAEPAASAPVRAAGFDGAWKVALSCAGQADGSSPYKFEFDANVKDNFLRGARGDEGSPGWLKLQGPIAADGNATLEAFGMTGDLEVRRQGARHAVLLSRRRAFRRQSRRRTPGRSARVRPAFREAMTP